VSPADKSSGKENSRPNQWLKSNLVALGSAAVLVVYSAGYARTRSAAERFSDEANERRPPERRVAVTPPLPSHVESNPVRRTDSARSAPAPAASAIASAIASAKRGEKTVEPTAHASTVVSDKAGRPAVVADSPPTPAKISDTNAPVAPVAIVAPSTAPTTPTAPTSSAADTSAKSADTAHVQLKDGTFSGWGTSRHGDIEAAVQIKDGHIASAFIVQCLTRYSCSWISMLPGQVVTRQSAEVDYVSGATQSSNAFYFAIVEALSKAK
jgi:uncharacterized protein with FMN-binding domain